MSIATTASSCRDGEKRAGPQAARGPRGALLINLGTPDTPDPRHVRRYLAEFLSDPEVIRLPRGFGWLTPVLGRLIAYFRAKGSAEMYQRIWTPEGSPLRVITEQQAAGLATQLPDDWRVFYAMRYGNPSIPRVLDEICTSGIHELVVVPMYPQFSGPSTRTALTVLYEHLNRRPHNLGLTVRTVWHDDVEYINAQARLLHSYAETHRLTPENALLLFSAHSLPVAYVRWGDPYLTQITHTRDLVLRRLGWPAQRSELSFQSRLGPVEWLGPQTDHLLARLAADGEKNVLVCPLSFTADCLETLEEIGLRYREQFEQDGRRLYLCPALNRFPPFVSALRHLVLHGTFPADPDKLARTPLITSEPATEAEAPTAASLVMVGACSRGRLGAGDGPPLAFMPRLRLREFKRPQCDVPDILRTLRERAPVSEVLLWNTCQRYEAYALLKPGAAPADARDVVDHVRRALFSTEDLDRSKAPQSTSVLQYPDGRDEAPGADVNVLFGPQAWRHMARTAAGLNSDLPGESDVGQQLDAAYRLAEHAGAAGRGLERVRADVQETARRVYHETGWGAFGADYCEVALSGVARAQELDLAACKGVVVGGSTTSCAILQALVRHFGACGRNLTLLHRGHRRGHREHLKMLRRAIGAGRRVRVQSYAEHQVLETIADCDVVLFGIDSREPVLDGRQLSDLRDFRERPLTIVDFNVFSSTVHLEDLTGVRLWDAAALERLVSSHAEATCSRQRFKAALQSAEDLIARLVPSDDAELGSSRIAAAAERLEILASPPVATWSQ